ncbi:uncharacterized protein [Oscarella lobularis]|uniref:uncharacterized protein isoform X2 n=1 Tax=Oscarella lobularis TaxID=121494 RepID=UPI00331420BE
MTQRHVTWHKRSSKAVSGSRKRIFEMSGATSKGDDVENLTKGIAAMEFAPAVETTALADLAKEIDEMRRKMAARDEEMAARDEEMAARDEEIKEMKKRLDAALSAKTGFSFDVGEVITIPCLLPDAISMVSWKHRRVTNDKPTVIQELEGDQDLVIPFAKLGDAGTYHCETTLHDGRIQKSMQVKVFVEAPNRKAPHATGSTPEYRHEFRERHAQFQHSPLFFEHFQTFSKKTRKKWRWSEEEEEVKKTTASEKKLPHGCAERLQHLGRQKEHKSEADLMKAVNACLEEALDCKLETRGAKTAETRSARSEEKRKSDKEKSSGSAGSEGTKSKKKGKSVKIEEEKFDDRSDTAAAAAARSEEAKSNEADGKAKSDKKKSSGSAGSEGTKSKKKGKSVKIEEEKFDDRSDAAAAAAARSKEAKSNEADGKAKSQRSSKGPYPNDGAFLYEDVIVIFVIEGKLHVLTTGDPLFQVLRYYEDFRDKLPPKWGPNGNLGTGGLFPCYAATLSGNKLILFGVVTIVECGEELSVEKISFCELASVDLSHTLQPIREFLSNLRCAVDRLKEYYTDYKEPQRPEELFPSLPTDGVFNGKRLKFKEAFSNRPLMFLAKWGSDDVIVKFTDEKYGDKVHRFCSDKRIAPALHGVKKVGPFQMVVMEKCDKKFVTFNEAIMQGFEKDEAYKSVKAALDTLYKGPGDGVNYVHGDFRDVNVLINNEYEVRIIDFDWAGRDSEVTYPVFLNRKIHWHDSAKIGHPVLHEHDEFCLDKYFLDRPETEKCD